MSQQENSYEIFCTSHMTTEILIFVVVVVVKLIFFEK